MYHPQCLLHHDHLPANSVSVDRLWRCPRMTITTHWAPSRTIHQPVLEHSIVIIHDVVVDLVGCLLICRTAFDDGG